MENRFMPDATEQERIQELQDTAHKVREEGYDAPLTDDEIENRKSEFFKNSIEIEDLEVEKKETAREFSDKIKDIKSLNRNLRGEIKSGTAHKDGILYDVTNFENGYMETYDKTGELIEKRKLTPAEKQGMQSRMFVPDHIKKAI